MPCLPLFLTLCILMAFAGSSNEDISEQNANKRTKENNLDFDLSLLRPRNKIALSWRWPPSFFFFSLYSHIGHKASGLRCPYHNLWRIRIREI